MYEGEFSIHVEYVGGLRQRTYGEEKRDRVVDNQADLFSGSDWGKLRREASLSSNGERNRVAQCMYVRTLGHGGKG
jgi:hypothetical protein